MHLKPQGEGAQIRGGVQELVHGDGQPSSRRSVPKLKPMSSMPSRALGRSGLDTLVCLCSCLLYTSPSPRD
eukprot:3755166-Alexandrium_andersonii.AAC.1